MIDVTIFCWYNLWLEWKKFSERKLGKYSFVFRILHTWEGNLVGIVSIRTKYKGRLILVFEDTKMEFSLWSQMSKYYVKYNTLMVGDIYWSIYQLREGQIIELLTWLVQKIIKMEFHRQSLNSDQEVQLRYLEITKIKHYFITFCDIKWRRATSYSWIYSHILEIFIEQLLYDRQCSRCWGHISV